MSRVVVVGSANIDIITRVDRLPGPGQTLLGTDPLIRPGGKGANQAVAARRAGADTTLIAMLGADTFGDRVRTSLRSEGVHLDHVAGTAASPTGMALIVVAADGENTVVVAPGANDELDPSRVRPLRDRLRPHDVVLLQLEVPVETCLAAADLAHGVGARVVLNAAPPPGPGTRGLDELLSRTDVLVVNESEALAMTGVPGGPADAAGWTDLARRLRERGPDACVVTLGGAGAVVHDGERGHAQPAFPADVVDTTGAGDAFCGALAAALAAGAALPEAVRHGCAAGALATGTLGAQSAPGRTELDQLLGAGPR